MEKQNIKSTLSQIYYNTHPIILKWIFANIFKINNKITIFFNYFPKYISY